MFSVKVKCRPSVVTGKVGSIYYQIISRGKVCRFNVGYKVFDNEWDNRSGSLICSGDRTAYLIALQKQIDRDIEIIEKFLQISSVKRMPITGRMVSQYYREWFLQHSFPKFMMEIVAQLQQMGKYRTAEAYSSAFNSFMSFCSGREILLDDLTSEQMLAYEAYLKNRGVTKNSSSFYMRILRAVYNRAVEDGIILQKFPFRHVYTGVDKTVKRAIPIVFLQKIKQLKLSKRPSLDFARDMFLFSFYTRGMSFVDMAYHYCPIKVG